MQYVYELMAPKVSGDPFANGFIWITDTSVAMTSGKILAVLALDANHYKNNQSAPTLQDVHWGLEDLAARTPVFRRNSPEYGL
jgi:hypothetical protein